MELTNDQKVTIEYFRKRPEILVAGRDGSNSGDDIYTVIRSALDYASAESYSGLIFNMEGWIQNPMSQCAEKRIIQIIRYTSSTYYLKHSSSRHL